MPEIDTKALRLELDVLCADRPSRRDDPEARVLMTVGRMYALLDRIDALEARARVYSDEIERLEEDEQRPAKSRIDALEAERDKLVEAARDVVKRFDAGGEHGIVGYSGVNVALINRLAAALPPEPEPVIVLDLMPRSHAGGHRGA